MAMVSTRPACMAAQISARNWDDPATFEALKQLRRGQPKLPPGSHRVRYLQLTPAQTQAALRHGETPEEGILAMLDAEGKQP
jgi:hypothetical protein